VPHLEKIAAERSLDLKRVAAIGEEDVTQFDVEMRADDLQD
jgi:hypothetical protein